MTHRRLSLFAASLFVCALFLLLGTPAFAQTPAATVTTLQSSSACQTSGCITTLTATVTAGSVAVHPGMVVFCDLGPTNCENEAPIGRAQLTANGTATIRVALAGGPHTLRAVFYGTKTYASSISVTQNVTTMPTAANKVTTLYQPGVSTVNGVYEFDAQFDANGPLAPTGTVSFRDTSNNNALLGSVSASAGTPLPGYANPNFTYASANADLSQVPAQLVSSAVFTVAGDFNNDGLQDLALVDKNTNLTVLLGNGNGGFTVAPAYNGNTGAHGQPVVADFNGDGKLDVAIPDSATNTVRVSLGNGDGTFTHAVNTTLSDSPQTVYLGDFDGDGIQDLVAISYLPNWGQTGVASGTTVHVMLGKGDGTFTPIAPVVYNGNTIVALAAVDFNRDGFADIALTYYTGTLNYTVPTTSVVLKNNGDGTFASTPAATLPGSLAVLTGGDFDGDGIPDLLAKDPYETETIDLFHGNGDFTFTEKSLSTPLNNSALPFISGDFTGSGSLQVSDGSGTVIGADATGTPVGVASFPFALGYFTNVAIADYNGDGLPDFFYPNSNNSMLMEASISRLSDVSFKARTLFTPGIHNIVASYSGDSNHSASVSPVDPFQGPDIDYTNGFTGATNLAFNGAAALSGSTIKLTNGGYYQAGSFFAAKHVSFATFQSDFDFTLGDGTGDGFAFVVQANGPNAIGSGAGGLGYGNPPNQTGPGITNSIAIAFDLHNNQGEGGNSIRLEDSGKTTGTGAIDLTPYKIDLHSGDPFHATISYNDFFGMTVFIQDLVTARKASLNFYFPNTKTLPDLLLGSTGYIGFTGASGGGTGTATINNWLFSSSNTGYAEHAVAYGGPSYGNGFAGSTGIGFNGVAAISGNALQLTNGTKFQATTAYDVYKVLPQTPFNTDFDFQIENGVGDGFTFVLQGNRLASIGQQGGGLGYGPLLPTIPSDVTTSIPNSLAIKFDTHNDAGEGSDSTGIYVNGASPTVPSIDLGPTGINLQNGHVFHAHLSYATNGLTLSITDLTRYENFTTVFPASQYPESALPAQTFVGFTAGTGATASSIKILNWDWTAFQPY